MVTVCASLVNIHTDTQTDRQHFDQLMWTAEPAELKILEQVEELGTVLTKDGSSEKDIWYRIDKAS